MNQAIKDAILAGRTALGIELGSTRIKAVLIGEDHSPIASGSYDWENRYENGIWTYRLEDVWIGLQQSYQKLRQEVEEQYGVTLSSIGAIGFSAMMHGYLAFDAQDQLLVPFRTWRNTITGQAAAELTGLLEFNIPQRWSVAHLYQAILNGEEHVNRVSYLTTLSGYVHWKMTGQKVLGVGDASGMFPIDRETGDFHARMLGQFDEKVRGMGITWSLKDILPKVLPAGAPAGTLTAEGAKLLDPSGTLQAGIPVCPPEGDAGTGMVATNSVAERTGNVSAGTSVFAMIVLEKELSRVYPEIDMVTTPTGRPVAMAHCNTCTSDLDAWVSVFREVNRALGGKDDKAAMYDMLYYKALEGDDDCGGLVSYNYYSGEPVTGLDEGRPLFVRTPDAHFTLANFMRAQLFSTMATLKLGMDLLFDNEKVRLDRLLGHGGLFKTKGVGQKLMAGALGVPVAVMETAGEGGAWGIALLAAYLVRQEPGQTLEAYLDAHVFAGNPGVRVEPDPKDVAGFKTFIERYVKGLAVEKAAVEALRY